MTGTTDTPPDRRGARVLGHLALYYRPGEEAAARTLLTDLGCELVDNGPRPGEDGFASALVDGATANHHDNVVYLARMGEAQWELEQQVAEMLAGPAGADFHDRMAEWPESAPHVGLKYESLDDLEAAVLAVEGHAARGRAARREGHRRPASGPDPASTPPPTPAWPPRRCSPTTTVPPSATTSCRSSCAPRCSVRSPRPPPSSSTTPSRPSTSRVPTFGR